MFNALTILLSIMAGAALGILTGAAVCAMKYDKARDDIIPPDEDYSKCIKVTNCNIFITSDGQGFEIEAIESRDDDEENEESENEPEN